VINKGLAVVVSILAVGGLACTKDNARPAQSGDPVTSTTEEETTTTAPDDTAPAADEGTDE
jgi:hypothetical protein